MRKSILLGTLALLLLSWVTAAAEPVTEQDVYNYIDQQLHVSAQVKETLKAALKKGFADGRITPERALQFLQRIEATVASVELKEGVLLTIAFALLEDLPVEMLINKVEEGLAKGVTMDLILAEIQERFFTLREVKLLLDGKGLKVNLEIQVGLFSLKLSITLMDIVITDIAGALEDYVRGGGNPEDTKGVKEAVISRLRQDKRVPDPMTNLIEQIVSGEELSQIAQNIVTRLKAQKG